MEGGKGGPKAQPAADAEATLQAELKAVEAELGTVDDDLAQFFTGVRYRAVAAGVVRAGPGMESAKSAAKLAVGQEILMLEQRTLEDGTRRLRFAGGGSGGWVSETAKTGKRLLEPLAADDYQARLLAMGFTAPATAPPAASAAADEQPGRQ